MKTESFRAMNHPRARGFTLIELMIVVVAIAVLAAIAYPSYLEQMRKSRRSDAKTALLDLATRQERFFSINNVYANTPAQLGYAGAAFPVDVTSGSQAYYQLQVAIGNPATSYSATAAPRAAQVGDKCGTYTINELGVQGNSGNTIPTAECW